MQNPAHRPLATRGSTDRLPPAGPVGVRFEVPRRHDQLSQTERAEAEQVARRLVAELRPLVTLLPEADRGASAMSRLLRLDRATCQRLVAALARSDAGVETLVQLPGIQGLRQFIDAVAHREPGHRAGELLEAARAAVERLSELIDELGGSQRKLRARLAAERAATPEGAIGAATGGSDDPVVRQAMFHAAAAATGRWCDVLISLVMIRPTAGAPELCDSVYTRAMIGHRARPDAVPLEVGQSPQSPVPSREALAETEGSVERAAGRLIEEFCSRPLPRISSRSSAGTVAHVVDVPTPVHAQRPGTDDAPADADTAAADIVLSQNRLRSDRHPATLDPPIGEVWRMVSFPARYLVFDVFLHKEIARRCIPSLEVHLWAPEARGHVRARWSTRFSGGPRLEMMGPGLSRVGVEVYPRYGELAAHIIESSGWNPAELVGYRCELPYPLWRAGYCMSFDFSGNEIEAPAVGSASPST